MTRKECEAKIVELMCEIYEAYKQYNPVGNYLALFLIGDALMGNNAHYDIKSIDYEKKIDFYKKLSDGEEDDEE